MGQALPRFGGAVEPAKGVQIMDVARMCDNHYANDCNVIVILLHGTGILLHCGLHSDRYPGLVY